MDKDKSIEVTKAMMRAGAAELFKWDPPEDNSEEVVKAVYLAMRAQYEDDQDKNPETVGDI